LPYSITAVATSVIHKAKKNSNMHFVSSRGQQQADIIHWDELGFVRAAADSRGVVTKLPDFSVIPKNDNRGS
jgi:short subunit dehydrogenase-like uncharacterized protein